MRSSTNCLPFSVTPGMASSNASLRQSAHVLLHDFLLLTLPVALFLGFAFVVHFFTFRHADFTFDAAVQKMQIERNQRVAGTLDFADQLADFSLVEQEFAGAYRIRVDMGGGGRQGADMGAEQVNLAIAHDDIGLFQLHASVADGFDYPAVQDDTRFEALLDKVVVKSFSIVNNGHGMV